VVNGGDWFHRPELITGGGRGAQAPSSPWRRIHNAGALAANPLAGQVASGPCPVGPAFEKTGFHSNLGAAAFTYAVRSPWPGGAPAAASVSNGSTTAHSEVVMAQHGHPTIRPAEADQLPWAPACSLGRRSAMGQHRTTMGYPL